MKRLRSVILILISVILIVAIYELSSQNYFQSNGLSRAMVRSFASLFHIEITDMTAINQVIRKIFHAFYYMILTMILFFLMKSLKKNLKLCILFSFFGCLLMASIDEIHQLFVPRRTGSIWDVLIDMIGGIAGILFSIAIIKIVHIIKNKYSQKRLK